VTDTAQAWGGKILKKLLLVSDEEDTQNLLKDFLEKQEYEVCVVGEAGDALKKIEKEEFKLVITDLYLPGINGMELLRKIKRLDESIEVVIISDYGTSITKNLAKQRGAYEVIEKPVSLEKVGEIAKNILTKTKGKVLVVDDHEALRKTILNLLLVDGYEGDEACDGIEALEKVKTNNYDIVLMDIHMPRMGGIEAVKNIKKIRPYTYIVMMTGEADEEEVKQALSLKPGYYACLRKPFDMVTFSLIIKDLREESLRYKQLAQRTFFERFVDTLEEKKINFLIKYDRKKGDVGRWVAVIVFSLIIGLFAGWAVTTLPKYVENIFNIQRIMQQQREEMREEIRKEIERREEQIRR
jgi:DNA-binding NtrC family response regulator